MFLSDNTIEQADSIYLKILQTKSEPILYEDANWFILFAKRPCNEGHLLIIPKLQTSKFHELPFEILQGGFEIATKLSQMLDTIYRPPQVALFIKGFTNDNHAHIHISPAYASEDTDKDLSRPELSLEQMVALSQKLKPEIFNTLSK